MNPPETRKAALEILAHPERYPGLRVHKHLCVPLRVWCHPSFDPYISWAVLKAQSSFYVRRVIWDQSPTTLPEPNTFGSEAALNAQVFVSLMHDLQTLAIPPFSATALVGLDGTRYGIEASDTMSSARLTWWEDHPETWAPLRAWHERAVAELEAPLPAQTPLARLR